jgi:hypothetical protein
VTVEVMQQDAAGNLLERRKQNMQLQLTRAEYDSSLQTGLPFRTVLSPKDGLKTMRVVVTEGSHTSVGSLIIPVSEIK